MRAFASISTSLTVTLVTALAAAAPADLRVQSPNKRIEVRVTTDPRLAYDVLLDGHPLLAGATMSMDIDHVRLGGAGVRVRATRRQSVDRRIEPPVRQKAAVLPERFEELTVEFAGDYAVVFRAYDQGVAYRFETTSRAPSVKVYAEEATFAFAGGPKAAAATVFYPREESFFSHNERVFRPVALGTLTHDALGSIPAVVDLGAAKIAVAESDVGDYPGLWLRGTGGPALAATFPPYPLEEKLEKDRDFKVVRAADYIAVTRGARRYPWRLLAIAEHDTDLVASTLVYLLARPSEIADPSWIHPGKVSWDWWNALNLRGTTFKPGVNTATYEAYIDFAARSGLEYVILDEGWYKQGDLLAVVPEIDMPRIVAHARAKHVRVILWTVWKTLADQLEPALAEFEKWGIAGVKVDFMQRDDQLVMQFYDRVCRALAARKMLVDFHGGIRPALLARTWPNLVSTEGVQGMEHLKWSAASDPEHNVTLPFTRMLLGPMDYTPGAMLNATRATFKVVFNQPMSLSTRCQQLAMYVVYESPLQMLADSPSNYAAEPEAMELLGPVPTVWDETRVLAGRIGDYVVVARRSGRDWWVGAMTDWTARTLPLDLSFLGAGNFEMTAFEDGPDAATKATDYCKSTRPVTAATRVEMKLAPGGGFAARIRAR